MTEHFVARFVHAVDGVAVNGDLLDAAEVVAVELHALRVGFVGRDGFLAVQRAHTDAQQICDDVLSRVFADDRRYRVQPGLMILVLGKLREQLDIGSAGQLAQELILRGLGCADGQEREQAHEAEDDGKQFLHGNPSSVRLEFFNRQRV